MPLFPYALLNPNAYKEKSEKIKLLQTHISWVFLTAKYAYKVKKPVNFGFADFSTLEKRKFYCHEEIRLNSRLCPDLYFGVVPITKTNSKISVNGSGKIIEYAVKMKQMPQNALMNNLLERNKIYRKTISKIAEIIADFHKKAETEDKYGSVKTIKFNWNENFEQTKKFINKIISRNAFDYIMRKVNDFIKNNKILFEKRIINKKIKWCHGDLHSGNIFIADKIYIFDCVEFNKRISCTDVASDVAFFSVDLDFYEKRELSKYFVKHYIKHTNDMELLVLLNFYKCYRAYVRAKVFSFRINELGEEAVKTAKKYFNLALEYSELL